MARRSLTTDVFIPAGDEARALEERLQRRDLFEERTFETSVEFGFVEDDEPCLFDVTFETPGGVVTI